MRITELPIVLRYGKIYCGEKSLKSLDLLSCWQNWAIKDRAEELLCPVFSLREFMRTESIILRLLFYII